MNAICEEKVIGPSNYGENRSISMNQDGKPSIDKLAPKGSIDHSLGEQRHVWFQLIEGNVELNETSSRPATALRWTGKGKCPSALAPIGLTTSATTRLPYERDKLPPTKASEAFRARFKREMNFASPQSPIRIIRSKSNRCIVIMKSQQSMKNNSNPKANKPAETQTLAPLHVQIEMRAYEIWIASGSGHGRDLEHWLQAEAEILKATQERSGPGSRP